MREESAEREGPLRTGWTTGACATAAACAAVDLLFTDTGPTSVQLNLPRGRTADLAIADHRRVDDAAEAGVIKNAGDDPDATHGARVWVQVRCRATPGVSYAAGAGVGTITRAGLALAVGEPAINPKPREILEQHLAAAAERHQWPGGFDVTIGVDNGEAIARDTMNPRLGIEGGISILGTTGIVRPFSCAAFIASIHQGIDVARTNGVAHIAACTGATSERTAREQYGLPDMALVEMGDFIGAVLKHLRHHPVARVTLVGGFGKFSKLAAGRLDTHSRKGGVDFDFLADKATAAGGDTTLAAAVRASNTSLEALEQCQQAGVDLAGAICDAAHAVAAAYLADASTLEVWTIDKAGRIVGRAGALAPA